MDCSPPGSSIHGIFQARVLEWGAIAFSDICLYSDAIIKYNFLTLLVGGAHKHKISRTQENQNVAVGSSSLSRRNSWREAIWFKVELVLHLSWHRKSFVAT